ncbi:B3/4 domain-containing protein [Bacillus sp. V59.32b]|uniref:B3/B4 domain-containing protein n=1 Tax=Bacillus sp. V59.32b TaxID=1758642 RepID=UPI0020B168A5|nr:phenylalanine--tRNA ligase beta subunit-related protein [Bacillus sp. V59.32b]
MVTSIHASLCNKIPDFKAGIITYDGIQVGDSPQMVKGRLQLFQESIFFDLQEKELTDFQGIKEWRQVFKAAGTDPSRYRPSAEALYRRIKKQNYLPSVNSAIDLNNFFSLQYEVPIGIYDTDQVSGDTVIKIGESGDDYTGINGRTNSMHNMIASADGQGTFGSPFVDSERTKVTEETKNALQIIYLRPSITIEDGLKLTESLMDMFVQVHGGEATCKVITCKG